MSGRHILFLISLILFSTAAEARELHIAPGNSSVYTSSQMIELKMILAKLRESMGSMKELDDLEQIGMPASEVDLMREALKQKISEMTSEALISIERL